MQRAVLLLVIILAACASASGGGTELPPRVMTAGEAIDFRLNDEQGEMGSRIPASADDVWAALPDLFSALAIPVTHLDPSGRVIGNRQYTVGRTLAGEPVHRYFNCGSGVAGPVTSTHQIRISLLARVEAAGTDEAELGTSVVATAHARSGASGHPISCGSTGRLESRIVELLREMVA